jgi:hypothetical protein
MLLHHDIVFAFLPAFGLQRTAMWLVRLRLGYHRHGIALSGSCAQQHPRYFEIYFIGVHNVHVEFEKKFKGMTLRQLALSSMNVLS